MLFSGGEVPPAHELHSARHLPPSTTLPGLPEAQLEEHALSWPSSGKSDAADYEEMLSSMMATSQNEDLFGQLGGDSDELLSGFQDDTLYSPQ